MNIFIIADIEGISGVCRATQTNRDEFDYQAARKYLTWDINACVEGCIAGGAKEIVVRDEHAGGALNSIWQDLDPRAEYIQGITGWERIPGTAHYDGLILLGFHAMAGTPEAVLEHTWSGANWQNFYINGVRSGEMAIDAGIAGDHGVPVIMVTGDDKTCREAKRFFGDVVTVQVKKGLDREGAQLLPKERAHQIIREGAEKACREYKRFKPYKIKKPLTMRLELVSRGRTPNRPYVRVLDGRTYEVTARTVQEGIKIL